LDVPFLEKGVSAGNRARLKPVPSEAEGGMPMNYLTLIPGVDLPESDAGKIIPEPTGLEPATNRLATNENLFSPLAIACNMTHHCCHEMS